MAKLKAVVLAGGVILAAFYLAAAADPWMPRPLNKLTSPVRTFTVLMLATLSAAAILFRPARGFWKETKISGAS